MENNVKTDEITVKEHHFIPDSSKNKTKITISDNLSMLRKLKMKIKTIGKPIKWIRQCQCY